MGKKRTGKLVIETGFTFGGGEKTSDEELKALKKHLKSDPNNPTNRDKISKHVDDFFKEINRLEALKSLETTYNFYHVLEDPDDIE